MGNGGDGNIPLYLNAFKKKFINIGLHRHRLQRTYESGFIKILIFDFTDHILRMIPGEGAVPGGEACASESNEQSEPFTAVIPVVCDEFSVDEEEQQRSPRAGSWQDRTL